MKVIPINKVIKEIEGKFLLTYLGSGIFKEYENKNYNDGLQTAIQIIKDNIKEVDDNKIDKLIERADKIFKYLEPELISSVSIDDLTVKYNFNDEYLKTGENRE